VGFFTKKRAPTRTDDPLAVFDGVIASLERQAAEVRRSAATLLALQGELARDEARQQQRLADLEARHGEAEQAGDGKAAATLERDRHAVQRRLAEARAALAAVARDAELLKDTAGALAQQVSELKDERLSAKARMSTGALVTEALKAKAAQLERVLKLDAARDEVERAHALAELYRDDAKRR
jgi:phage shock protein A